MSALLVSPRTSLSVRRPLNRCCCRGGGGGGGGRRAQHSRTAPPPPAEIGVPIAPPRLPLTPMRTLFWGGGLWGAPPPLPLQFWGRSEPTSEPLLPFFPPKSPPQKRQKSHPEAFGALLPPPQCSPPHFPYFSPPSPPERAAFWGPPPFWGTHWISFSQHWESTPPPPLSQP